MKKWVVESCYYLRRSHLERAAYVLNGKDNCWWSCNRGPCDKVCGSGGYCCRKDYEGCPSDMTEVAPEDHHTCIQYRQGEIYLSILIKQSLRSRSIGEFS